MKFKIIFLYSMCALIFLLYRINVSKISYVFNVFDVPNVSDVDAVKRRRFKLTNDLIEYEKDCIQSRLEFNFDKSNNSCPCISYSLIGNNVHHFKNLSFDKSYIKSFAKDVLLGGSWTPRCVFWQNVAIIIPFRDRKYHLSILLNILHPFLQRQQAQYTIFVIEQASPVLFNRASLMNVGFIEANSTGRFDCFIFHDVDMLPEDDRNFYTCSNQPVHLSANVNKFNYRLIYPKTFGGVSALSYWQFDRVNGFSNQFYGWGGEDDEMAARLLSTNLTISRRSQMYSRYTMIKHHRDANNPTNKEKDKVWKINYKEKPKKLKNDGFRNLKYQIIDKKLFPLYTWILVKLEPPVNRPIDI